MSNSNTKVEFKDVIEGRTVSKKYFVGEVVNILNNTIIVRKGAEAEVIRKSDIIRIKKNSME